MKGYLRRVVPSTKGVREATKGQQAAASRLAHYTRRGMTNAVSGAETGVRREADRAVREARKLRVKSLAAGAGYGAAAGAGGVLVSRKKVEKADLKGILRLINGKKPKPESFVPPHNWKRPKGQVRQGRVNRGHPGIKEPLGAGFLSPSRKYSYSEYVRDFGKAFKLPTLPKGRLVPKSRFMRKPSVRSSYIGTSMSGKKFTVRGSVR